ncbi:pneumococcal serine-rich repeat protein-like [Dermacentor albipictus]|uniref:pneumococcal serine-rich repeat protein-like n=1 Tax=Dermacentor albipictus TaxID=60249 RepID=UPI0038FC99E4
MGHHAAGVTGLVLLFLVLTNCPAAEGEPKTGALREDRATTSQTATDANATQSSLVPPRAGRRVIVYMGNRPWFSSMYGAADASRTEYHVPSSEAKPSTEIVRRSDARSLSSKESGQTGVAPGPAASDKANKLSRATLLASETTSNEASTEAENDRPDLIGELDVNKHPSPPLPPFNGPKTEFRTTTVHHTSLPRNDDVSGASGAFQQDRRDGDADVTAAAVVGANRRAALQESTAGRSSSAQLSAARQEELADRNLNSRYFTFGPGSATAGGGSGSNSAFGTTGSDDGESSRDDDPAPFNGGGDRFNQQRPSFGGGQDNRRPSLPPLPPPPPPRPAPPAPTASPPTAPTFGTTHFHLSFPSAPAIFGNNSLANRGDFQFETSHDQDSSSAQRDGDGRSGFTSAEQRTTPPVRSQALRQFPTLPASRAPTSVTPPPPRRTSSAERTFQTFANQRQAPSVADAGAPNSPSSAGQTLRFNFRDSSGQARTNPPPPPPRPVQTPVTNSFVTYFTNSDSRQPQKSAPLTDTRDRQQSEPRLNFRSGSFQTAPPRPPPQRPTSTSFFQGPQASQTPRSSLRNNLNDNNGRSRDFSAPNARSQVTFRPNVFPVDPPSNTFASNQATQNGFTSSPRSQEDFSSSPRTQNSFAPANTLPRDSSTPRSQNSFSPANTLPRVNFQTSQSPRSTFQTPRPSNNFQANQRSQNDFSSNSRQPDSFDGNARGQNNAQGNSRVQDTRFQSFGNSQSNFQSNDRRPSSFTSNQPSSQTPAQRSQGGFAVNQRPSDSFQGNQRDRNAFPSSPQRPQNNFAGADQSPRDRVQTSQRLQEAPRGRQQNSFQNAPSPRPQPPVSSPPALRNPTPQNNNNANPQDNLEPFRNDFQIALRQRAFSATTASPVDGNDGGNDGGRRPTTTQNFQSSSQSGNAATRRKTNRVVFIPGNFGVTPTRRPDPYRSKLPGLAGSDYPTYSEIPFTNFKCSEQSTSGMFADVEAGCQVFHSCDNNDRQKSFLCPNGTIFKQELFTCDWWYNVDCDSSSKFFHLNAKMYTTTPRPQQRNSQDDVGSRSDSGRSRSF